jgi:hypothetical protein
MKALYAENKIISVYKMAALLNLFSLHPYHQFSAFVYA